MLRDDGHRGARETQATGSTKIFALTLWIIKMTSFFPLSSDIISSVWAVNGSLPSLATAETNACVKVCMFLFFVKPSKQKNSTHWTNVSSSSNVHMRKDFGRESAEAHKKPRGYSVGRGRREGGKE